MNPAKRPRPALRLVRTSDPSRPAADVSRPSTPTLDDSQLLLALRAADPSVAGELHDRLRPVVDRTVRRLLGSADQEREDVVQNALLEILGSIDRFRGDSSLDAWASTIAAHVVFKRIRRRRLERAAFVGGPADELVDSADPSARHAADLEQREVIARVTVHLSAMDEGRAWAFLLHDVWGYDLRETASILEVSIAAAQSRLVRGRHEIHARVAADPALAGALAAGEARDEGGAS